MTVGGDARKTEPQMYADKRWSERTKGTRFVRVVWY